MGFFASAVYIDNKDFQTSLMYGIEYTLHSLQYKRHSYWKRHSGRVTYNSNCCCCCFFTLGDTKRLNTIVKALLLRRTKDQMAGHGKPLVELPRKAIETVEVMLATEERTVYEKLFRKTQ